nr:MAG TPA_asm: hypothetical protein [Caudoviricetes sp.]
MKVPQGLLFSPLEAEIHGVGIAIHHYGDSLFLRFLFVL